MTCWLERKKSFESRCIASLQPNAQQQQLLSHVADAGSVSESASAVAPRRSHTGRWFRLRKVVNASVHEAFVHPHGHQGQAARCVHACCCYCVCVTSLPGQIAAKVLSSAAAAAAGELSFSSDVGRERSGQGGLSMSASMPLISQLESTFQTGRR